MTAAVRRAPEVQLVAVTARTVRTRDAILVGGRLRRVVGVEHVHGGARLDLDSGERLILSARHQYTVQRPLPPARDPELGLLPLPEPDADVVTPYCTAARAGGERWAMLHGYCRGPLVLTVPGGDQVLLPCACPCHRGEDPA